MAKARTPLVKLSFRLVFYPLVAWLLGFGYFYITLPAANQADDARFQTDGIVVLTGGAKRIEAAIDILRLYPGARLLISGVNPIVDEAEIGQLSGIDARLLDCCVELDRLAKNTAANAYLGGNWAAENNFRRVTIVTADYHIPRSRLLFKEAQPTLSFEAYAVETDAPPMFLVREYNKYLFTIIRKGFGLKPDIRMAVQYRPIPPRINNKRSF